LSRIRQGFELAGASWRTFRGDRALAVFPVLGGISAAALVAAFAIPGILLASASGAGGAAWAGAIILFAIAAYLAAFVGIFFAVALAACADHALRGEAISVRMGIAAARERIPQIAGWAAVTTTINLILRAIETRFDGVGGAIISALGGMAWALVTFLAVPVIAFEGTGPMATLKRSSGLFRQRWGQQVGGIAATSGIVAIIGVLPGIVLVMLGVYALPAAGGIALLAIGIILIVVASIIGSALAQILAVALYRFAADGVAVGPFTEAQLNGVVRPRRARGRGRGAGEPA